MSEYNLSSLLKYVMLTELRNDNYSNGGMPSVHTEYDNIRCFLFLLCTKGNPIWVNISFNSVHKVKKWTSIKIFFRYDAQIVSNDYKSTHLAETFAIMLRMNDKHTYVWCCNESYDILLLIVLVFLLFACSHQRHSEQVPANFLITSTFLSIATIDSNVVFWAA